LRIGLYLQTVAFIEVLLSGGMSIWMQEVLLLLVDEYIVALSAVGHSNPAEVALTEIDVLQTVEFLQNLAVVYLIFMKTGIGTGFCMHDGTPTGSLKVLKTDLRINCQLVELFGVDGRQFEVEGGLLFFEHL
jgi:hypothetical protein